MNQSVQQHETPAVVRAKLDSLRVAIRRYVWLYGVAAIFCAIGAAFWTSLVLDWFFEPHRYVRVAMQVTVFGAVLWLFYRTIFDRLCRPLTDSSMALLLERQFPELGDCLLTTIDPNTEATPNELSITEFLYRQVGDKAAQAVSLVDIRKVFDYKLLRRSLLSAVILWLLIAIFAIVCTGAAKVWANRVLFLSEELWPRQTRLALLGTDGNTLKVASGDDLSITIGAALDMLDPQTVRIDRYSSKGRRESKTMTREGEATAGRDAYQTYTHTFHSVRENFEFYAEGGDADLGPIQVEVVKSPTVGSMKLNCVYPPYMQKEERDVAVVGPMTIPKGTTVRIEGRSLKPLTDIKAELIEGERKLKNRKPCLVTIDANDPYVFRCNLDTLTDSVSYRFTLKDTDGIQSREPYILTLTAADDEAPLLPGDLHGIGPYITPFAYLPVLGRATDDYGIEKVWFDYTIDPEKKGEVAETDKDKDQDAEAEPGDAKDDGAAKGPVVPERHGIKGIVMFQDRFPTETELDAVLDLQKGDVRVENPQTREWVPVTLTPGQKLAVTVAASDHCSPKQNIGFGRRRVLEVVEPERLRTSLQIRELSLRQRFEIILDEARETQQILNRLDLSDRKKNRDERSRDELGVRRAIENCRKHVEEVKTVADSFEDIRLQILHNRLAMEKDVDRLKSGVIDPLREVAAHGFPELEKEIEQLLGELNDPELGPEKQVSATKQADLVVKALEVVLGRMFEMEAYEALQELLRSVIDDVDESRPEWERIQKEENFKDLKDLEE